LDTAQKILELIAPFVKQDKILPRTHIQIKKKVIDVVIFCVYNKNEIHLYENNKYE
jgi:hypothetical protein